MSSHYSYCAKRVTQSQSCTIHAHTKMLKKCRNTCIKEPHLHRHTHTHALAIAYMQHWQIHPQMCDDAFMHLLKAHMLDVLRQSVVLCLKMLNFK